MKENYEILQLSVLSLFFLFVGPVEPLCFIGVILVVLHCVVSQLYLVSEDKGKPSEKLKISHYVTIYLAYICAIAQFGLGLFNVI